MSPPNRIPSSTAECVEGSSYLGDQPEELEPFKRIDETRWAAGQPNAFDVG